VTIVEDYPEHLNYSHFLVEQLLSWALSFDAPIFYFHFLNFTSVVSIYPVPHQSLVVVDVSMDYCSVIRL
jgi:hypothetical protein